MAASHRSGVLDALEGSEDTCRGEEEEKGKEKKKSYKEVR